MLRIVPQATAVHRIGIVALETAGRAGESHLVGPEQHLGEAQEQRHAEDHDDDRDHSSRRARQRDVRAETVVIQRRRGEMGASA